MTNFGHKKQYKTITQMKKMLFIAMAIMASAMICRAQAPAMSAEQQQAVEKLVPVMEPAMVSSMSKYLGPQKGDVFEYNAELRIDGKCIVVEQNIVGWKNEEDEYNYARGGWEHKTTTLSRSYVNNMPFILKSRFPEFYKWFAGVAGYSGYETIDILRNKADKRADVIPNSYFLQTSLTPQVISSLNNSLDKYDIMSMNDRSIVVYLMVPANEYDEDLALGKKIPEAVAIAVVYGLNLEVTVYNAGAPKTKKTISYSFNDLLKKL